MAVSNQQRWNPGHYAETARFVADLAMPVVELLAPRPGERILDLGCGDGALTAKLLEFGCEVVGVDSSREMIAVAKSLGLNAQLMDGEALEFYEEFDAVFSNAALHWMQNPRNVIDGVWRSLKPHGRFVGEFGGWGNVATIIDTLESALLLRGILVTNPWFFPRPEEYKTFLEARGFTVQTIALLPRPTPLPGDLHSWLEMFAQPYTSLLPAAEREQLISHVVEVLRPVLCSENGKWVADYVRLRFVALKPAGESNEKLEEKT